VAVSSSRSLRDSGSDVGEDSASLIAFSSVRLRVWRRYGGMCGSLGSEGSMLGEADVGADSGSKSCVSTVESLIVRADIVWKKVWRMGGTLMCCVLYDEGFRRKGPGEVIKYGDLIIKGF